MQLLAVAKGATTRWSNRATVCASIEYDWDRLSSRRSCRRPG